MLGRILLPALLLAFAPHLPPLAAAVDQGDILRWLGQANWTFWLTLSFLSADVIALLVLRGRSRIIRLDTRARLARALLRWKRGGASETLVEHDGVLWPVLFALGPGGRPDIRVSPTPRCPACKARLESRPRRPFRHWHCPSCGFRRTVRHAPEEQAARLVDLALAARDAPGCAD